jgi:hypothetical protein
MTTHTSDRKSHTAAPATNTPGRPKDSGSRQQTHPDQGMQSGSGELDKSAREKKGGSAAQGTKPTSAK